MSQSTMHILKGKLPCQPHHPEMLRVQIHLLNLGVECAKPLVLLGNEESARSFLHEVYFCVHRKNLGRQSLGTKN